MDELKSNVECAGVDAAIGRFVAKKVPHEFEKLSTFFHERECPEIDRLRKITICNELIRKVTKLYTLVH